jgi:hypothetical protein
VPEFRTFKEWARPTADERYRWLVAGAIAYHYPVSQLEIYDALRWASLREIYRVLDGDMLAGRPFLARLNSDLDIRRLRGLPVREERLLCGMVRDGYADA